MTNGLPAGRPMMARITLCFADSTEDADVTFGSLEELSRWRGYEGAQQELDAVKYSSRGSGRELRQQFSSYNGTVVAGAPDDSEALAVAHSCVLVEDGEGLTVDAYGPECLELLLFALDWREQQIAAG